MDYAPEPGRSAELAALPEQAAIQWVVTVLHPLAHLYADGRSTYAPGLVNDATRALRTIGFDLSATEALGRSVWVTDGMGDSFLRLRPAEIAERDAVRAGVPVPTAPF